MIIEERLARMKKLKKGLERNLLLFSKDSNSETEKINKEIEDISEQTFQDELRLAHQEREAKKAYCPVARMMREKAYCENMPSGERCASFEKCYDSFKTVKFFVSPYLDSEGYKHIVGPDGEDEIVEK